MITSKSNSVESKEVHTEYCCENCFARLGRSTEVQKPTTVSQKKSSEQSPKTNIICPPAIVYSPDKNEKENEYKWTLNCREGKVCPTISIVVNRKKLEQIAKLSIESALNQKLSEILSTGMSQKQSNSESRLESDGKEDKNKLDKWKYNCQEGKPCPTIYSMLNKNEFDKPVKQPSEACFKKEIRPTETSPAYVTQKRNSNDSRTKNESDLYKQNQPIKSLKETKRSELIGSQKSVHLSQYISTFGSNNNTNKTKLVERPFSEHSSTEIKSTELSQQPNRHSVSTLSYGECEDDNELDKWKKNCHEGVFALQNLVDKCEKDPNSVLATFKVSLGKDRKLPNGSSEIIDEPEPLYILQKSHGHKFGDSKYHLLMVDASTSIHRIDFISKSPHDMEKVSQRSSVRYVEDEAVEVEEIIVKDKGYQTYVAQKLQQKQSEEMIPEVEVPEQLQQPRLSHHSKESQQSEQSLEPVESPQPSLQKDQKPIFLPTREKKGSILFKDNLPPDMDEEERKRQYAKRPSGVSWRALNTPSDSDSTASLEQVVKDATAKAETFRQNLDAKRQHSLLDIVKRKSTIDKKIEDPKPPAPPPPKRKKFFNFKCLEKKKPPPEKEKEDTHSDSEDESVDEIQEKKPAHSSSMYLDNYRRRNTSFIENPVFEKKKELNQFLNNI